MITRALARLCSGRLHYSWVVLAVMFVSMLAGVGVRAAPGVMIVPLQRAFGWDVATISGAVSLNIILLGATGPFMTGLIDVIGLKRTILSCMAIMMAGTFLSIFMTSPWQLFVTWGLMVGIGSGAGAVGIAAAVANRWFTRRTGLAMGLLTAANAAGQLMFLPLLACWPAAMAGRPWPSRSPLAIGVVAAAGGDDAAGIAGVRRAGRLRLGHAVAAAAAPGQSVLGRLHRLRPRRAFGSTSGCWSSASASAAFRPTG